MEKKEKIVLNKIFINLSSICWKTQTLDAQEKWKQTKLMFKDIDISLKDSND